MKTSLQTLFQQYIELNQLGQTLQAITLFYADTIEQIENNKHTFQGKDFLYQMESDNLAKVNSLRTEFESVLIDEEKQQVWGEMHCYYDSKQHGAKVLKEAFFQQWENGKIIRQKFFYHEDF